MEPGMTSTIFVWDMAGRGSDGSRGVGHASIMVGKTYISWWPAHHDMAAGVDSRAKTHTMHDDKLEDGVPQFASSPIKNLNEAAIETWWNAIKKANSQHLWTHKERELGSYRFLSNNCATTVFRALLIGSDKATRKKIWLSYLQRSAYLRAVDKALSSLVNKAVGDVGTYKGVYETIIRSDVEELVTLIKPTGVAISPADIRAIAMDVWS